MRASLAVAVVLACGCAVAPVRAPQTPETLDANSLEGTWVVGATTFPMWLDGTRVGPTFTYSNVRQEDGRTRMDDAVRFTTASGQSESILGVDTQHPTTPTHFTWRGLGLLALFTSEWDVVSVDPGGRYAIIVFSPTLATPAGLDVISRGALSEEAWVAAQMEIEATPALKAFARGLTRLPVR